MLHEHEKVFCSFGPADRSRTRRDGGEPGRQYTSQHFQELLAESGVACSMSRSGNVWDNAAMECFFSSLKTERIRDKCYQTRDAARADVFADVFDDIAFLLRRKDP